jgi:geranylgeranyl pyrophosphate synthase
MVQKNIIYDAQTKKTTVVDYTAEEQAAYDDYNSTEKVTARKLEQVKEIRLEKLQETDYLANTDVVMADNVKTWRQSLRDIPANHTDENAYDLLLARDSDGKLTHSIWSKP